MRIGPSFATTLAVALSLVPATAAASCGEMPPVDEHLSAAEIVFVGTVVSLTNLDRTALVDVHEVWAGAALPAQVTVHGGMDDPQAMTSTDRTYTAGVRYLFAVTMQDDRMSDDACTATREWTAELADLRPETVATPPPLESGPGAGIPATAIAIAGAVLLIGLVSVLAFRSRA
jgi:hypothetical protein